MLEKNFCSQRKKALVGLPLPPSEHFCFFSSIKQELSLSFATPSNSQKGGFYNCEGFERHAITKDKSLSPLKFFLPSYPPRSIPPVRRDPDIHPHTRARALITTNE